MKLFKNLILVVFILSSCNKEYLNNEYLNEDYYSSKWIYKFKGNYYDKVCIMLTSDEKHVLAFPADKDGAGGTDTLPYIRLRDNYIFHIQNTFGANSVILDITRTEYQDFYAKYFAKAGFEDSLLNHILDKEPFFAFYVDSVNYITEKKDLLSKYDINTTSDNSPVYIDWNFRTDTALINKLIESGELEKYFTRVK